MQWVMQFILGVRKIKGEMNIAPVKPVPILLADCSEQDRRNASSTVPSSTSSRGSNRSPSSNPATPARNRQPR